MIFNIQGTCLCTKQTEGYPIPTLIYLNWISLSPYRSEEVHPYTGVLFY